jgi:hypothetical protein
MGSGIRVLRSHRNRTRRGADDFMVRPASSGDCVVTAADGDVV